MRLLLFFLIICAKLAYAQQTPEVAFTIAEKDLIPEGIAYDPSSRAFFVGSIHKHKVVRLFEGRATDFATGHGLQEVLGMKVHDGRLWVCNNSPTHDSTALISNIHVFDVKSGKLLNVFTLHDTVKHLFNDIVLTSAGEAYITDSDGGAVYRIRPGGTSPESFLPGGALRYPNGICLDPTEKRLIVSTGNGLGIVIVDIETKTITPLQHEKFLLIGVDGLYRWKESLIVIQNVTFPEAVLMLTTTGGFEKISDIQPLASDLPQFNSPTTGVIVGNHFYFIANSQLLQVVGSGGKIKAPGQLKETVIMQVRIQ